MKTLKFKKHLSNLILKGEKTTTWRLFDNKDLTLSDKLSFLIKETGEEFVKAKIVSVKEVKFSELSVDDWEGHEKFSTEKEMYDAYSEYYKKSVDENTKLKIIKFEIINKKYGKVFEK